MKKDLILKNSFIFIKLLYTLMRLDSLHKWKKNVIIAILSNVEISFVYSI
jgi:hypothetical protein